MLPPNCGVMLPKPGEVRTSSQSPQSLFLRPYDSTYCAPGSLVVLYELYDTQSLSDSCAGAGMSTHALPSRSLLLLWLMLPPARSA